MTTLPASAVRTARIHHPTAWGRIEDSTALVVPSSSAPTTAPSACSWAWNRGSPAAPSRSRIRYPGTTNVLGLTILAKARVV
jgi:hypothetical protein